MKAEELYEVFMKAVTQTRYLKFEDLPLVAQDGWKALADYVNRKDKT